MPLVFVYGTLKRGGANHHRLDSQRFITTARTVAGFTLYQPADYPGMIEDATDREGVTGEVWDVSAACLAELDRFEGVHENLYRRVPIQLAPPHTQLTSAAYLYLPTISSHPHIGSTWPVNQPG